MTFPYGPAFAVLCLFQGLLVAAPWCRPVRRRASRLVGLAVPIVVFGIGLVATQAAEWSTEAVAALATYGTPVAAAAVGYMMRWRMPLLPALAAPAAFVVAWRADGLVADVPSVALIGAACLTLAVAIATFTPPWALAAGLVVLAIVDTILVFSNQVAPSTEALHSVVPAAVGGRPLPALQDATLGRALFGWLDMLAPALAATLLAGPARRRLVAASATAAASLAWGFMLHVSSSIPGTVPPLVAVAIWALSDRPRPTTDVDVV